MKKGGLRAALQAWAEVRQGRFAAQWLRRQDLSDSDRRLATALVNAAARRRSLWELALRHFLKPRPEAFSTSVCDALILIAAGLTDLPTFEPAVLISGLVEAVKASDFRGSRAVNAVARRMGRELRDWIAGLGPARQSELLGLTPWACERLKARGESVFQSLCAHMNDQQPLLAFWALPDDAQAVYSAGFELEPGPRPNLWRLKTGVLPVALPGFSQGLVWPASETALCLTLDLAALLPPDALLLELCAGRGVKTGLLLKVRPDLRIAACDLSARRLEVARQRLTAAGLVDRVSFQVCDGRTVNPEEPPDAVFIDAPCSGSGTWARHPESRFEATEQAVKTLAQLGFELACRGYEVLKPGGLFFYATCSLFEEENEALAGRLASLGLKGNGLYPYKTWWPDSPWSDGFFVFGARKEEN